MEAVPLSSPDPYVDRLCELALRDQWSLEDLDWASLELGALPEAFRQVAADAFAQLHWGERTAGLAAQRLAALLPEGPARAFCESQAVDEQRHVAFFARVIALLGCEGRVRPSVARLMSEIEEARTPEALMLGMQILIEGAAHSLFIEAARLFNALDTGGALDGPLRSLKTVIGDWMPRLLARDESRHIAFGLHFLRGRVAALEGAQRQSLEEKLACWGEQVLEQARDPDLIDGAGVDGALLCDRLVEDLNLRIAQIGLTTRIGALRAAG